MKGCHAYVMLAQIRINEHATGMLNLASKILEHSYYVHCTVLLLWTHFHIHDYRCKFPCFMISSPPFGVTHLESLRPYSSILC